MAVEQVGADVEVRKKREVLRDVADVAQARGEVHPSTKGQAFY
jgi:mannitol/fructose-specific phosphotransferase system IIA component (Ntr-type)